jgi:hypothetical protein
VTLPLDLRAWSPEAIEHYRERAAIIEVLGKTPRARAEALAEEETRRHFAAGGDAAWVARLPPNPC